MWELDHKEGWVPKNWRFWTVVLEKTLESPLEYKEIQPVNPRRNQSWMFIGRTDAETDAPILWASDVKNRLIRKDPDAGKDWRQEKGTTEHDMVGWHHWLNGHEFEQALGDGKGQGRLAFCSPWGCRVRHNWVTEQWHVFHGSKYTAIKSKPHWGSPGFDCLYILYTCIITSLDLLVHFFSSRAAAWDSKRMDPRPGTAVTKVSTLFHTVTLLCQLLPMKTHVLGIMPAPIHLELYDSPESYKSHAQILFIDTKLKPTVTCCQSWAHSFL